jgi:hypothetical protein
MFGRKSLGRWLILPAALLGLSQFTARAVIIDLTIANGSGTTQVELGLFTNTDNQSTGTGVIQWFVRVQSTGTETDYNTDARPTQFDENNSPNFTRHLNLSAVPVVTIGRVQYREFLLDINQTANNPLLSLNKLQLFVGNSNSPTGGTLDANGTLTLPGFTRIYDLDAKAGGDSTIELNFLLNRGAAAGTCSPISRTAFSWAARRWYCTHSSGPRTRLTTASRNGPSGRLRHCRSFPNPRRSPWP